MVDASLIFKGIEVKWARKPGYKNLSSFDARIQIVSKRKSESTGCIVTNNENLRITPIINRKRSTI